MILLGGRNNGYQNNGMQQSMQGYAPQQSSTSNIAHGNSKLPKLMGIIGAIMVFIGCFVDFGEVSVLGISKSFSLTDSGKVTYGSGFYIILIGTIIMIVASILLKASKKKQ